MFEVFPSKEKPAGQLVPGPSFAVKSKLGNPQKLHNKELSLHNKKLSDLKNAHKGLCHERRDS